MRLLVPKGHELTSFEALLIAESAAFPMISYYPDHEPGMRQQTDAIVRKHAAALTIAGEASSLTGLVTRIGAGLVVGLVDSGHLETWRRADVAAVPLTEDECIAAYVLHKHQRFGLPDSLQRFLAHVETLN